MFETVLQLELEVAQELRNRGVLKPDSSMQTQRALVEEVSAFIKKHLLMSAVDAWEEKRKEEKEEKGD